MSVYLDWKPTVLGKIIGSGQCVDLVVNNSNAYVEHLFPGVSWTSVMAPVASAYELAGKSNQYLTWVANDHANVNQLPSQGDIMVFGPTPETGYTDDFDNPAGHCGVCDSASTSGYGLLAQNSPATGDAANVTEFAWKYRPCLGWYTITGSPTPSPSGTVIEINAGTWNVRTGAGVASPIIGIAKGGQEYGPAEIMTNGWAEITFTGRTGYVAPAAFKVV